MARKSFWNAYDHLGGCFLLNLLWSLLSLPWMALAVLLVALGWSQVVAGRGLFGLMLAGVGLQQLLLSPVSAALWQVTAYWAHYRTAPVKLFFPALRRYFGRAMALWLCFSLAAFLLSINVHFYDAWLVSVPLVRAVVIGLIAWAYLTVVLMEVYAQTLLVQRNFSIRSILRNSFLLVADNVWYSVALTLSAALVMLIGLISGAGFFFLAIGLMAVLTNTGLRELLRTYRSPEEPKEQGKPRTWAEVRAAQERAGEREEETRGWRDLWRPWEDRGR
jgi:uncharacterized membrane protein YesL